LLSGNKVCAKSCNLCITNDGSKAPVFYSTRFLHPPATNTGCVTNNRTRLAYFDAGKDIKNLIFPNQNSNNQNMKSFLFCLCSLLTAFSLSAQVKIGDNPLVAAHPSAILELKSTAKGLLIPRLDSLQQAAIASPANGLIVFNTTRQSMEYYDSLGTAWRRVARTGTILAEPQLDSLHWQTDTAAKRVILRRAFAIGDSIFYNYKNGSFVFADKINYTNSLGNEFPVTTFTAKYHFKSTASFRRDTFSVATGYSSVYATMEADERLVRGNSFTGLNALAIANKNNTRTLGRVAAILASALQSSQDTVQALRAVDAVATHSGTGYVNSIIGVNSTINITDTSRSNIGTVFGSRVVVVKSSPPAYKISALFGSQILFINDDTTLSPITTNDAIGLQINPVNVAPPGRNYAIRTFSGVNILGDSTTIGFGGKPRAILDVTGTSSMIIPTGFTNQRPATGITGMLRINSQHNTIEHFDGLEWKGTIRTAPVIDVPLLPIAGGASVFIAVPGAVPGGTVTISPSAATVMPAGLFIAWARVTAVDNIEVRFENRSITATLDPVPSQYHIRVIN
jgi:hypothetical protein